MAREDLARAMATRSPDESLSDARKRVIAARTGESQYARSESGFDALNREQGKQMLEWLMARLPIEQRGELMRTLPQAYNAWCGRTIVVVVPANDSETVGPSD